MTPALAETTSVALDYLARTYLEAYHDTARADAYARKAQQLSLPNSYGWVVALAVQGKVRVLEKRWPQARAVLLAARAGALTDHEIARLASV